MKKWHTLFGLPSRWYLYRQWSRIALQGERERHTLESLLATRLSERAIFYGKVFAPVILVWALIQIWMLVGAIIVNLLDWQGTVQFF